MTEKAVAVRVAGRVQGVSFRAWTQAEAEALGLDGWVRNAADGSVEAHLQGPADAVEAMLRRLREGPSAARVTHVLTETAEPVSGLGGFTVRG
ncbi:acylphosphatase [Rhodosalinus halophilus]|uniref:Acylphosphatase n=1 Tax=Rhodosalinus halophilus TaxID=2259333 RepID=A0A365U6E6_9RHOB|nr:acylphosphatase [Rhodosalinus halophilus]RBI84085.1 acylphosphatase [Rhodosalinus halophilus]